MNNALLYLSEREVTHGVRRNSLFNLELSGSSSLIVCMYSVLGHITKTGADTVVCREVQ